MAQNIAITRKRGDTYRIRITFTKDDGSPLDLTNSSLLMTVSPIALPDEASDALFTIIGSIVGAATDGVADFQLTAAQADNVGEFYYDVEMTDVSGSIRTILEGAFTMTQDITKGNPLQVFIPNGTVGEKYPMDCSDVFRVWCDASNDTQSWMEYAVRDSVPVISWLGPYAGAWWTFEFAGDLAIPPYGAWGPTGVWEFTVLVYWTPSGRILFRSDFYDICHTLMSCSADRIRLECESYHPYGYDNSTDNQNFFFGVTRTVDEWAAMRYRIDCDTPQVSGKVWYPADPVNWEDDEPVAWEGQVGTATYPLRTVLPVRFECQNGGNGVAFDIARIGWERLS